jgi:hypothetical protein
VHSSASYSAQAQQAPVIAMQQPNSNEAILSVPERTRSGEIGLVSGAKG